MSILYVIYSLVKVSDSLFFHCCREEKTCASKDCCENGEELEYEEKRDVRIVS